MGWSLVLQLNLLLLSSHGTRNSRLRRATYHLCGTLSFIRSLLTSIQLLGMPLSTHACLRCSPHYIVDRSLWNIHEWSGRIHIVVYSRHAEFLLIHVH